MTAGAAAVVVIGGAQGSTPSQLALMPLPAKALGAQVAGLPVVADSGVVSNDDAAAQASGTVRGSTLAKLGRLSGYRLDFGGGMPTAGSLYEVETEIEQYESASQAAKGLAFWRADDADHSQDKAIGARVKLSFFKVAGLGSGSFADDGTVTLKGVPTFAGADVDFRVGAYVGRVTIDGRSLADVRSLAVRDAHALRARMLGVVAGRVSGRATPLPKAGRPHGGPDLASLALGPSDFTTAHVAKQGYQLDRDFNPVAEYVREMSPAGTIASFRETVALFRDPTQAGAALVLLRAALSTKAARRSIIGGTGTYSPHPVSLEAGDDAFGLLGLASAGGKSAYIAYTVIRVGRTLEITVIGSPTAIPITDSALGTVGRVIADRAARGLAETPVA
jgi:hypothetical protein